MKIWCLLLTALNIAAQEGYVSAQGGLAVLSGDVGTSLSQEPPRVSLYDPRNGLAFNLAGGLHLNDWLSIQGNYIWNGNEVTLTEVEGNVFHKRTIQSRQNAAGVDALVYFRPRSSRIRPYLSGGGSAVHIHGGRPASWRPGLRVAVGIDLLSRNHCGFRYTFSEMLTANPFDEIISPPGRRKSMNFQNLFGIVKYF